MKYILYLLLITSFSAYAQLPTDAIYMPKNTTCVAFVATNSNWKYYWENNLKRQNLNIGKLNSQAYMPMAAIGLGNTLNLIVGLPYIKTQTSSGNLMGQKGFQDISAWLKYRFYTNKKGLTLHSVLGVSAPVSNYVPNFLPLSIGLHTKTATARFIANYLHAKSGIYSTASMSFTARSKIKIDQDAYYSNNVMVNSNQVVLPNTADMAIRIGYINSQLQYEVFAERFACLSGDYIRRNDMPFPTNDMKMTSAGAYFKYQPQNIGFNAKASYVLAGKNVGQTTTLMVGLLYQINY